MEQTDLTLRLDQLVKGLKDLQRDYETLFGQHTALQDRLTTVGEQYNQLAKLSGKSALGTPPSSLTSTAHALTRLDERPLSAVDILEIRKEANAARSLRSALDAADAVKQNLARPASTGAVGVKIWSGPSADQNTTSNKLPSITESPMEQDFTIVGTPSKLGCPFAGMANKKLSTHAASVLSRYHGSQSPRDGQSVVRDSGSVTGSSASRLNGHDSVLRQQSRGRRRSSIIDPIKAEICGLDSHGSTNQPPVFVDDQHKAPSTKEEPGVCPIRFLNQHSPQELAEYFEKHKHELPRSHEVCVRRYQSDEQQVRELDARYGDVAQMIRGLGEKHQNYLPKDIEEDADAEPMQDNHESNGRVERWAKSLSAKGTADQHSDQDDNAEEEIRERHFARPLRDIRLGESPSRPWGIPVPTRYADKDGSESSAPVRIQAKVALPADHPAVDVAATSGARCPFARTATDAVQEAPPAKDFAEMHVGDGLSARATQSHQASDAGKGAAARGTAHPLIINGPIVIGYGPEEAARFLQSLGR